MNGGLRIREIKLVEIYIGIVNEGQILASHDQLKSVL